MYENVHLVALNGGGCVAKLLPPSEFSRYQTYIFRLKIVNIWQRRLQNVNKNRKQESRSEALKQIGFFGYAFMHMGKHSQKISSR